MNSTPQPHLPAAPRLPPGQQLVARDKWPIIGEREPAVTAQAGELQVTGLVACPQTWTLAELQAKPVCERTIDLHCVTRWSRLAVPFRGVLLTDLLSQCAPHSPARYVIFRAHSPRGHSSSLPLEIVQSVQPLVVWMAEGRLLEPAHGGPLRLIVPDRYLYKSVKWLAKIELAEVDELGYWESAAGYHNGADPWREERYLVRSLPTETVRWRLAKLDLTGCDWLGLDVRGESLSGLRAAGAVLRNAQFQHCSLANADFSAANLSNASFEAANLRGAKFCGADLEGADFTGADLRGADLTAASLVGASFVSVIAAPATDDRPGGEISLAAGHSAARIDETTRWPKSAIEQLTPLQQKWLISVTPANLASD